MASYGIQPTGKEKLAKRTSVHWATKIKMEFMMTDDHCRNSVFCDAPKNKK